MSRNVRAVRAGEWATWRGLRLDALTESPDAFAYTHAQERTYPDEWWIDIVGSTVDHPRGGLWFAELDGVPVGMLFGRLDESVEVMELGAMWVAPQARGLGLGKALLDHAIRWARQAGATTAQIWVATANPAAEYLYRSRGFTATGATQPLRPDSPVTALELEVELLPSPMT